MQKKARGPLWKSAKQFLKGNETWWYTDLKADVAESCAFSSISAQYCDVAWNALPIAGKNCATKSAASVNLAQKSSGCTPQAAWFRAIPNLTFNYFF